MAFVYVLYSKNLSKHYVGSCLDLEERISDHRNRKFPDCFTAKDTSWQLIYALSDLEYVQARNIERHIKRMKSSKYIENLMKYEEISEKLKEKYT